jgi:hypothetical protein
MWADFTAGGHSNFYDFSFWRGTGRTVDDGLPSRSPAVEILEGGKYLLDFVTNNDVHFQAMTPHDELASLKNSNGAYVMTLANPPSEYVCYVLGAGPVTVSLKLSSDTFYAQWYDPQSGKFIGGRQTVKRNDTHEFRSPPFEQDIVLYVHGSRAAE